MGINKNTWLYLIIGFLTALLIVCGVFLFKKEKPPIKDPLMERIVLQNEELLKQNVELKNQLLETYKIIDVIQSSINEEHKQANNIKSEHNNFIYYVNGLKGEQLYREEYIAYGYLDSLNRATGFLQ
jgi:hypothetical protein